MNKYLIAAVALVVISMGIVGGASIAKADEKGSSFRGRVAELLGVSPDDLDSAITQTRTDAKAERLAAQLEAAVAEEIITQDEADAIQAWFGGKPDALSKVRHMGLRQAVKNDEVETFLSGLVSDELITQTESEEIAAWLVSRPTAIEKFRDFRKANYKCHGRRHSFKQGFGHRWHGNEIPTPAPTNINSNGA